VPARGYAGVRTITIDRRSFSTLKGNIMKSMIYDEAAWFFVEFLPVVLCAALAGAILAFFAIWALMAPATGN
jgi:hypothetical protein